MVVLMRLVDGLPVQPTLAENTRIYWHAGQIVDVVNDPEHDMYPEDRTHKTKLCHSTIQVVACKPRCDLGLARLSDDIRSINSFVAMTLQVITSLRAWDVDLHDVQHVTQKQGGRGL